jgi:hypothetical protein
LTAENTIDFDAVNFCREVNPNHKDHDPLLEATTPGKQFPSVMPGCSGARRRHDSRLGVSRPPLLEPSGGGREDPGATYAKSTLSPWVCIVMILVQDFYQQRLLMSLAWFCTDPPQKITVGDKDALQWTFTWASPSDIGMALEPETLKVATVPLGFSFEQYCQHLEVKFTDPEMGCVCACCENAARSSGTCESCRYAVGWHRCRSDCNSQSDSVWRAGTLHAGHLDIQRAGGLAPPSLHGGLRSPWAGA